MTSVKKQSVHSSGYAAEEWVTLEREYKGTLSRRTQLTTDPQPHGYGWQASPATRAEIEAEVRRRKQKAREQEKANRFRQRQDVKDAERVRSAIELYLEKIIGRLTPEEWAALADRLN